ncbi:MAG: MarR family winged helix-turn-helix transcriptional regulator [Desulfovibrio sp.]
MSAKKSLFCLERESIEWGHREGSNLLGLTIYEISKEWRSLLDQRLRPLGLSNSRWMALKTIQFVGSPVSQREIAEAMGVESPTLARALDQLEKDGWVRREVSEQDRRVKLVELESKATLLLEEITRICFEVEQELLTRFTAQELNDCHQVLLQIRKRIYTMNGKEA